MISFILNHVVIIYIKETLKKIDCQKNANSRQRIILRERLIEFMKNKYLRIFPHFYSQLLPHCYVVTFFSSYLCGILIFVLIYHHYLLFLKKKNTLCFLEN